MSSHSKETYELEKPNDGAGCYLHFSGGIRASKHDDNKWSILPVFENEKPHVLVCFDQEQLQTFAQSNSLSAIGFQRFSMYQGIYHSSFTPILPDQSSDLLGPSDLWSNIAGNICTERCGEQLRKLETSDENQIAKHLDDQEPVEKLARAISLSLRSMDIHAEYISEFYHQRLLEHLVQNLTNGDKSGGVRDQELFAHIHSFFLHLGAARDYLGSLIAIRIGRSPKKIDAMSKLFEKVKVDELKTDALIVVLKNSGYIDFNTNTKEHYSTSGWLKEVSGIRNMFVHQRPYGSLHDEQMGFIRCINTQFGLYRYCRPFIEDDNKRSDVLDIIIYHHHKSSILFRDLAHASGRNLDMFTLADDDIISIQKST